MYQAYVAKLKNVRKHSNADKLQCADVFETTVVVDMSYKEGQIGVYFPTDGQLGLEFAMKNNLLRVKDENGENIGGYLDPDKRNIAAITLRGEKSDGLFLSLSCLESFTDISKLKVGDAISILNGIVICEKYIPRGSKTIESGQSNNGGNEKKEPKGIYPYFKEHIDTRQLAYNQSAFREGDFITLTLKMHGTSHRISNTLVKSEKQQGFFAKFLGKAPKHCREWKTVSGSRKRIVDFEEMKNNPNVKSKSGRAYEYYSNNIFREKWHKRIAPQLHKGETLFCELVGWVNENKLIMPECNNKQLNDKEFTKKYGPITMFTYGCNQGESKCFVYRMIKTDEDGNEVEYPSWLVKRRCNKMGLTPVLELDCFLYTTWEDLMERVNKWLDIPDPVGKTHVTEGVVVRIENRDIFTAYKHKSYSFKVLEGIIKENAAQPDMEEAEELLDKGKA